MNPSKANLRSHYRDKRRSLDPTHRTDAALAVKHHLQQFTPITHTTTVAAFMATAEELDLNPWMVTHQQRGGSIALPRVHAAGKMTFHASSQSTVMQKNRYHIEEPSIEAPIVPDAKIDIALVPLVAFDSDGHRLGMGGGYYDRFLPKLPRHTWMIGVAFDCQKSPIPLPQAHWDVPLHAVVTETGMLKWRDPTSIGAQ